MSRPAASTRSSGAATCRTIASRRAPAFPGQPPQTTALTNNKGFAAGYTFLITSNLVNDLRYGLTRQGVDNAGASNAAHHLLLRGRAAGLDSALDVVHHSGAESG